MSIETEIKKLSMAVTQLTDYLVANHGKSVTPPPTALAAGKVAPLQTFPGDAAADAQMTAALEAQPTQTASAPSYTQEQVNQALVNAAGRCNDNGLQARNLLMEFGATTVSQIPVEQYEVVILRANALNPA